MIVRAAQPPLKEALLWHDGAVKTLRRPFALAILVLLAGLVWLGWNENVQIAVYALAVGLGFLALVRLVVPPKHTLNARGRTFDVVVLVSLAVALVILAPWGTATLPS